MKFRFLLAAALAYAFIFWSPAHAITVSTVPVGDVGNPNDPATGNLYGGVNTAYNIGEFEVTVGQYTAFLNAVAATDTYFLYNTYMATHLNIAGIARSGVSGNYNYSVIGSPLHPVTYVNWGDAARFANWLHNGQPIGVEDAATTEAGAYTLNGAMTAAALMAVRRNANATWFIPTENEWYKAAFYQPSELGGDINDYWGYPMRTNDTPYSDQPPGTTPDNSRVGNFYLDDGLANGDDDGYAATGSAHDDFSRNHLTDVGAFVYSPSYYGTFDQGGNVWEWNESVVASSSRGVRGGSWENFVTNGLHATFHPNADFYAISTFEGKRVGFRVANVPEPTSLVP